jgi:hypothetical protein
MKYAVEMGSGAMIYIQSFIKNGCGNQTDDKEYTYADTQDSQQGDIISLILFSK